MLSNNEINVAALCINDQIGCHLPIVYVSCLFDGSHAVDVNALSSDLAGMAHVVVEPNRSFSLRLQLETHSQNVYGGAIGVYWPDTSGRRSFFDRRDFRRKSDLKSAIVNEVRSALLNRRPLHRSTLAAVQEAVSR